MDWHLTWQDPVALALAVVCFAGALWLRRRVQRTTGCATCHAHPPAPAAEPGAGSFVALGSLRMSRRPDAERD